MLFLVSADHGHCAVDIIFAVDASGSIGERAFSVAKQIAIDIINTLPTSQDDVRVGFMTYTSNVEVM